MKRQINLFPLALVSWIMTFYLVIIGDHGWYLWMFMAIIFAERLFQQLMNWLDTIVMRSMLNKTIEQLRSTEDGPQTPLFGDGDDDEHM